MDYQIISNSRIVDRGTSLMRNCTPPQDHEGIRIRIARVGEKCPLGSLRIPQRALPTETQLERGMYQSKSGNSVNLSNSGLWEIHKIA